MTGTIERKYPVSPEMVGNPLSQEDMYGLLEEKRENIVAFEWFLSYSGARQIFESLRSENKLIGAEINERLEQPDASEIKLELRWPVKSDIVYGGEEDFFTGRVKKAKSYPSRYNSVTINFNRVQVLPYLKFEWVVSIKGKKEEFAHWASGSLQPWDVEKAIKKAFSNPKTKETEALRKI